jgi:hypothetical protein
MNASFMIYPLVCGANVILLINHTVLTLVSVTNHHNFTTAFADEFINLMREMVVLLILVCLETPSSSSNISAVRRIGN